jgi:hypothetical protein
MECWFISMRFFLPIPDPYRSNTNVLNYSVRNFIFVETNIHPPNQFFPLGNTFFWFIFSTKMIYKKVFPNGKNIVLDYLFLQKCIPYQEKYCLLPNTCSAADHLAMKYHGAAEMSTFFSLQCYCLSFFTGR